MRDYIAAAAQYQADVLEGRIPACKWVKLACARNRVDLDRQHTEAFPYRFDADKARKICQFAELLPYFKSDKAKIVGQDEQERPIWNTVTLEPWQCWILTTLFGWVRVADGLRRFRVGLILVPRKNGKSTLGAIVALYMFAVEGGSGAEVYSAATTRDQAKIVAEISFRMAQRSPQLREAFAVKMGAETRMRLTRSNGAKLEPLSADAQSLDGLNTLCAIIDELHAHRTRQVYDVIDTSTGAQKQPLLLAITTAGVEIGGICHEKLGYLEKILDGVATDDQFFGINYTIDVGDDIQDEIVRRKANPNYGVSLYADDLDRKIKEAGQVQGSLNGVLTKHFNIWIRAATSWMSASIWQSAPRAPKFEDLKHLPCWIGVDLGEVRDFSAVVLVFKTGPDAYAVIPYLYVPEGGIQRSPVAQLSGWVRSGSLIQTEGNEADYQRIEDDLVRWFSTLKVQEIDFDRRSARLMIQKVRQRLEPVLGRDRAELAAVDIPQTTETFDPAMTQIETLIEGGRLAHDGNEAMAWMIANVQVQRSNLRDEKYPVKADGKDSASKIDGPVALMCAMRRAMDVKEPEIISQLVVLGRW